MAMWCSDTDHYTGCKSRALEASPHLFSTISVLWIVARHSSDCPFMGTRGPSWEYQPQVTVWVLGSWDEARYDRVFTLKS